MRLVAGCQCNGLGKLRHAHVLPKWRVRYVYHVLLRQFLQHKLLLNFWGKADTGIAYARHLRQS